MNYRVLTKWLSILTYIIYINNELLVGYKESCQLRGEIERPRGGSMKFLKRGYDQKWYLFHLLKRDCGAKIGTKWLFLSKILNYWRETSHVTQFKIRHSVLDALLCNSVLWRRLQETIYTNPLHSVPDQRK